jgi:hypothetical protein
MIKFDIEDLDSKDINVVIRCLNNLSKISYESSSQIPQSALSLLLISLGQLLDVVNPFAIPINIQVEGQNMTETLVRMKQRSPMWDFDVEQERLEILSKSSNDNVVLLLVFNIIRNFSTEV